MAGVKLRQAIFILLCFFVAAYGESGGDWFAPIDAKLWQVNLQKIRKEQLPNRLTDAISEQVELKQAPAYSVKSFGKESGFEIVGRAPEIKTMKWVNSFAPRNLQPFNYYVIRYRARGIRRSHNKYAVLSISGGGKSEKLIDCTQVICDGKSHSIIAKKNFDFTAEQIQLELSTTDSSSFFSIESVTFFDKIPGKLKGLDYGVNEKKAKSFQSINLQTLFNDTFENAINSSLDKFPVVPDASFFDTKNISVNGIPFDIQLVGNNIIRPAQDNEMNEKKVEFLGEDVPQKYFFPPGRDDTTEVMVKKKVSEAFFILVSEFTPSPSRYGVPQIPFRIEDIEAFAVELIYEDGESEFAFPYSMTDEGFIIQRMTAAYAVAANRDRMLQKIVFHNRLFYKNVNIAAVTVNSSRKRVLAHLVDEPKLIRVPDLAQPKNCMAYMKKEGDLIRCGNSFYDLVINCENGFAIEKIVNRWSKKTNIKLDPSSGFEIISGNKILTGLDFIMNSVTVTGNKADIILTSKAKSILLKLHIVIAINDSEQIVMDMSAVNTGETSLKTTVKFPALKNLTIGSLEGSWLYFPQYKNVNTNEFGFHLAVNHQAFPMQFFDIYNPAAGIGIAIITHNLNHIPINYAMKKNEKGVSASIQYSAEFHTLQPKQKFEFSQACIVPHAGDWHRALAIYKDWLGGWYKPVRAKNRTWWDNIFLYNGMFLTEKMSRDIFKTAPVLDRQTGEFKVAEVLRAMKNYNGLVPDMIGCGDYFHNAEGENWGDYQYDYIGGLEALKSFIAKLNIPVSLYTIPDRCDKDTEAGKRLGEQIVVRRQDNSILASDKTLYLCTRSKLWRNYYVETLKRVQSETAANAMYVDVFGYWSGHPCYSKEHGHEIPAWYNLGTFQLAKQLRDRLAEDVPLWSEYQLNDLNSQYWDGNVSYYYMSTNELFAKSHDISEKARKFSQAMQNVYRFVFPDVKQFDFPVGIEHEANAANMLKFIFFNGEAHFDCTWRLYPPRTRQMLKKSLTIKKKFVDCFTSNKCEPLVPTEKANIYANKFPGNNRILWTVYNGRFTTVKGVVLAIEHKEGATYYDAWNNKTIEPKIVGGKVIITQKLAPQSLGCIVQYENAN